VVFHLAAQPLVLEAYRNPTATFDINVMGGVNVCEAVGKSRVFARLSTSHPTSAIATRTGNGAYRETDALGGSDPYSASKACAELVFSAYWSSFLSKSNRLKAASTRAGNVIGDGDWAKHRLIPDCIRALRRKKTIEIRHPNSTRPWQHVLDPLGGYLLLGSQLGGADGPHYCKSWNFGPNISGNKSVGDVVHDIIRLWGSGEVIVERDANAPYEDQRLLLNCDRANQYLHWNPTWNYPDSITETVTWYRLHEEGADVATVTDSQIEKYCKAWKLPVVIDGSCSIRSSV
jgi:CDP-glucose 4,6-dehydratase